MIEELAPCICGYADKLKGGILFGYLTIICPKCDRKLTGLTRSGNPDYILEKDLAKRWNAGETDGQD